MNLIVKSELKYEGYSETVTSGDNPKITGEPDRTFFNRNEIYEVLYLINKLTQKWNLKSKSSAFKLEMMINEYLPSNIRSQENVKQWLKTNWNNYQLD